MPKCGALSRDFWRTYYSMDILQCALQLFRRLRKSDYKKGDRKMSFKSFSMEHIFFSFPFFILIPV